MEFEKNLKFLTAKGLTSKRTNVPISGFPFLTKRKKYLDNPEHPR